VIATEYPRQFAMLDLGENLGVYGISWNSDLIEPMVKLSPDEQTIWVGVEQKLAAICSQTGKILLALPLTSYLVQMLTLEKVTAVITEEEFLLFNRRGSIRSNKALPDTAMGMSLRTAIIASSGSGRLSKFRLTFSNERKRVPNSAIISGILFFRFNISTEVSGETYLRKTRSSCVLDGFGSWEILVSKSAEECTSPTSIANCSRTLP